MHIRRDYNIYNHEHHYDIVTFLRCVVFCFLKIIVLSNINYDHMHIVNQRIILAWFYYHQLALLLSLPMTVVLKIYKKQTYLKKIIKLCHKNNIIN